MSYSLLDLTDDDSEGRRRNNQVEIVQDVLVSPLPGEGGINKFEDIVVHSGVHIHHLLLLLLVDELGVLVSLSSGVQRHGGTQCLLLVKEIEQPQILYRLLEMTLRH